MMTIERFFPVAIKLAVVFLGAAVALLAALFLMFGAAQGLGEASGHGLWFGLVLTGAFFLLLMFFFFLFAAISAQKKMLKKQAETKAAVESLWHQTFTTIALLLAEEFLIPYLQSSLKSKEHGNTPGFPQ